MTLKARAKALEAQAATLRDLRERSMAAAQQADLELVRVEAQLALLRDMQRGDQ